MIGGISHQEIAALTNFERNQIVAQLWPQERLVLGSTESRPLTGREILKMLAAIDLDAQANPDEKQKGTFRKRTSHLNEGKRDMYRSGDEENGEVDPGDLHFEMEDAEQPLSSGRDRAEAPQTSERERAEAPETYESDNQIREESARKKKKYKRKPRGNVKDEL